jgi:prepilin-type N-terminal cleavage/methylation domain-containing protein
MKALYRRSRGFVRGGGFTLIELLVGLTLLGLVAVAFYGIHNETQRTLYRSEDRADMQQNARAAMQVVVEELRNATRLMTTSDSQVLFLSDQYVPGQERTIRLDTTDYDDDGNQSELLISRSPNDDGSPGPGIEEIAAGIYDLNFRYFGQGTSSEDEDEVTSPIAVQRIEIQLAAETSEEGGDERRTVTLTSQVRPRNLGLPPPPAADSLPPTAPTGLSATASCGTLVVKW